MKKLFKSIVIAVLLLAAGNTFAGSVGNLMPYIILDSSNAISAVNSTANKAQDSFSSLYNAVPPAQVYTLSNSLDRGLTKDDMSNNSRVLAQETILCNAIFMNND